MQPHLFSPGSKLESSTRITVVAETMDCAARYHEDGNIRKAEQLYRQVLQSNPNDLTALHALGIIAHQMGNHHEAVELLTRAIAGDPLRAQFHNTLGLVFEALGDIEQALNAYWKAVSVQPDYAEAYHNMAIALQSQRQYAAAVEKCRKAVSLKRDYAEAYNTMGFALEKQQRFAEAIESYKQAVRLSPDFAEAYNHLGVILNDLGQPREAIESYRLALRADPNYAEAYNNLGIALKNREQFAEAIWNFEQALRLDPDFAEAHYNLANSLRDQGRCVEALAGYKRAVQLNPDYAEAHWNMSLTFLLDGNFEEGWKRYQWRRIADPKTRNRCESSGRPRWTGESFAGRRLFIHCEQGFGDNIQFVRYLPMIKARGGTVVVETLRPLMGLLRGFPGIDELVEYNPDEKSSVSFDVFTSLLDMPNVFGTTLETIPAEVPYIFADRARVEYWRTKISQPGFKVGIVWAGSPTHGNDRYRSCRLEFFAPLTKMGAVRLYGLQAGKAAAQMDELAGTMPITNLAKEFKDFTDTAAAIENMDLIISVDTSVLHLAGAMGKPAWALLPFAPEWRWMLNRQDSPWYPTIKLFRQDTWNGWDGVFRRVAEELSFMVERCNSPAFNGRNNCRYLK
jgi:tetratricopeptide (TPR) repeat protein